MISVQVSFSYISQATWTLFKEIRSHRLGPGSFWLDLGSSACSLSRMRSFHPIEQDLKDTPFPAINLGCDGFLGPLIFKMLKYNFVTNRNGHKPPGAPNDGEASHFLQWRCSKREQDGARVPFVAGGGGLRRCRGGREEQAGDGDHGPV